MSFWTALTMHLGMRTRFYTKIYTKIYALKPNLRVPCWRVLYFVKYVFSAITLRLLNLHDKSPKIFASDIIGLQCCLHPYIPC